MDTTTDCKGCKDPEPKPKPTLNFPSLPWPEFKFTPGAQEHFNSLIQHANAEANLDVCQDAITDSLGIAKVEKPPYSFVTRASDKMKMQSEKKEGKVETEEEILYNLYTTLYVERDFHGLLTIVSMYTSPINSNKMFENAMAKEILAMYTPQDSYTIAWDPTTFNEVTFPPELVNQSRRESRLIIKNRSSMIPFFSERQKRIVMDVELSMDTPIVVEQRKKYANIFSRAFLKKDDISMETLPLVFDGTTTISTSDITTTNTITWPRLYRFNVKIVDHNRECFTAYWRIAIYW